MTFFLKIGKLVRSLKSPDSKINLEIVPFFPREMIELILFFSDNSWIIWIQKIQYSINFTRILRK